MLSSSFVFLKKFRVIKKAKFIVDYQPEIGLRVFLLLDFVRSLVFLIENGVHAYIALFQNRFDHVLTCHLDKVSQEKREIEGYTLPCSYSTRYNKVQ